VFVWVVGRCVRGGCGRVDQDQRMAAPAKVVLVCTYRDLLVHARQHGVHEVQCKHAPVQLRGSVLGPAVARRGGV